MLPKKNCYQTMNLSTNIVSHKNLLQEYCQLFRLPLPQYHTDKVSGSAHEPHFQSTCYVTLKSELCDLTQNERAFAVGEQCTRKKCAELSAADKMLQTLAIMESELQKNSRIIETYDFANRNDIYSIYTILLQDSAFKTIFLWDVENYKLDFNLKEFEPCVLVAFDSNSQDSSTVIKNGSFALSDVQSRLLRVTSPTQFKDGADIAIIWMIAGSADYSSAKPNCIILSHDKLFCTVKDICASWIHGFESITIMT